MKSPRMSGHWSKPVVGAIDATRLSALIDETFGAFAAQNDLVAVPATQIANVGTRKIVDLDVPQTTIRFGRPGASSTTLIQMPSSASHITPPGPPHTP